MKKTILALTVAMLLLLTAACAPKCEHVFSEATCTVPSTCELCGVTEGEVLPHPFADATCTAPKTCTACGVTEGEVLPHSFADATCDAPKTCTSCGATEGTALEHDYEEATCTVAKTCKLCGGTEGDPKGHSYTKNVTAPTCTKKGYTTYTCDCGDSYVDNYTNPKHSYSKYKCTKCGEVDKSNADKYLMEWVKENGIVEGSCVAYIMQIDANSGIGYVLTYEANENCLVLTYVDTVYSESLGIVIPAEKEGYGYLYSLGEEYGVIGYLNGDTFSSNSALTYEYFYGDTTYKNEVIDFVRETVVNLLNVTSDFIEENIPGITIKDLGFAKF